MKLIALGDSVTYGQGVRSSEAWPAVLERITRSRVNPRKRCDVRNAGVCGDTTRLGLARFPKDVQLHRPDVVCIQFGLNDANVWQSDEGVPRVSCSAYVSNVLEMATRVHALGSRAIILRPHKPETEQRSLVNFGSSDYGDRVMEYAIALRDAAAESICAPANSFLDDGYGVHPDPAMHEHYAQLVAEAL